MSQKLLAWNLPRHKLIRHLFPPHLQTPKLLVALIGNFPLKHPAPPHCPYLAFKQASCSCHTNKAFYLNLRYPPPADLSGPVSPSPIEREWDGAVFCSEADTHLISLRNVPILTSTYLSQTSINSGINQPYRPAQPKCIYSDFCQKTESDWLTFSLPYALFFVGFPRKQLKPNITVC